MPNLTITIENSSYTDADMQVRLIVYNPAAKAVATEDATGEYILRSTSAEKILNVLREDTGYAWGLPVAGETAVEAETVAAIEAPLTLKEKQVLRLLSKGYSYKMIADELHKSVETIRVQIKSVYKKLQVCSNTQAIIKAMQARLI